MPLKAHRHLILDAWSRLGRGTRALLGLHLLTNLISSWLFIGFQNDFIIITPHTLTHWQLLTSPLDGLLSSPGGLFAILIFLLIIFMLNQLQFREIWRRHGHTLRAPLLLAAAALALAHFVVMPGRGANVLIDAAILGWLAHHLERQVGSTGLLRTVGLLLVAGGLLTALVLGLSVESYQGLLTQTAVPPNGNRALTYALFVPWALQNRHRTLGQFPITGQHILWFLVILSLFSLLFSGFADGLRALASIVLIRALLEEAWRPWRWPTLARDTARDLRRSWKRLRRSLQK